MSDVVAFPDRPFARFLRIEEGIWEDTGEPAWVYYSAQIFLFGAAITKAHYDRSRARHESPPSPVP